LGHAVANCNTDALNIKKIMNQASVSTICTDKNYKFYCINSFGYPGSYIKYPKIIEIKNRITNKNRPRIDKEKKLQKLITLLTLSYAEVIKI